ncbi:MAG: NUDIX hydrolase [Ardenticatenaceae bacterium]|nr:NUDIX hydrolase [Ardenticatenaceae bacterium]MCB9444222.1 NUDIX hydrolase [Ardenticatenaceae bacterium]
MVRKWEKLNSQHLADYRIFTVRQDKRVSPRTGREHQFYVLESQDWINVIPLTPEGKVVMIHQFRHGTAEITLEIPGGIVDNEDGDPAVAARRELLEETGYAAGDIVHIGTVAPNPAFLDNRCHTYLALDARWVQQPQFDGAEDIAVEEFDLAEVPELIRNGRINHALVIAAFYHYEHYRDNRQD